MVDAADAADAANGPNLQELFSEIGLRTDTLAASSKKLYTAPNPLHEALRAANAAVVRVVISDRRTGKHLQIGSGVITNASGRIRHAAHTVVQCMTKHNLTSLDDIAIRIAVYNGNSDGSRWAYWAESLTSLDEMKEKDERGRYLEDAWLQIRGTVSMSPSKLYPNEMTTTYTLDSYTTGGLPAFDFIPLAVYAPTTPDARVFAVDWAPGYSEHIHIHPVGQVVIMSPTLLKVDVPLNHGASGSPLLVLDDHGNVSVVAVGSYAITEVWTAPSYWRLARTVHATTAVFGDTPISNLTWVENAANLSLLADAAERYCAIDLTGGAEEGIEAGAASSAPQPSPPKKRWLEMAEGAINKRAKRNALYDKESLYHAVKHIGNSVSDGPWKNRFMRHKSTLNALIFPTWWGLGGDYAVADWTYGCTLEQIQLVLRCIDLDIQAYDYSCNTPYNWGELGNMPPSQPCAQELYRYIEGILNGDHCDKVWKQRLIRHKSALNALRHSSAGLGGDYAVAAWTYGRSTEQIQRVLDCIEDDLWAYYNGFLPYNFG